MYRYMPLRRRCAVSALAALHCVLFCSMLLPRGLAEDASPAWSLRAYHLYQPSDTAGRYSSNPASSTIALRSDTDMISSECVLDTALASSSSTEKSLSLAHATQAVYLNITDFLPTADPPRSKSNVSNTTEELARTTSDVGAPSEGGECEPMQMHSTGTLDLGVFLLQQTSGRGSSENLFAHIEEEVAATALPPPGGLSVGMGQDYEVSIFVGDFSRTLCITAAVYPALGLVGNLSEAIAVWAPSSISPACALRLSPFATEALGVSLSQEDFLIDWPPTRGQQCYLNEVSKFVFRFRPAQAWTKTPSYCAPADDPNHTGTSDTQSQRRVRCKVLLDVHATTWVSAALNKRTDFPPMKLAAAVTQVPTDAADSRSKSPSNAIPVKASTQSSRPATTLNRTPRQGSLSPYWKGTAWCTTAHLDCGFWISNATGCEFRMKRECVDTIGTVRSRSYVTSESILLSLIAVALALASGITSTRLITKVCLYWCGQAGGRLRANL